MIRTMMLTAAIIVLPAFGAAFAQGAPALAGTWFAMLEQPAYDGVPDEKLQLSANGTAVYDTYTPYKWKAENDRLTLTFFENGEVIYEYVYKYAISGATLFLTRYDNGEIRGFRQYSKTAKQKAPFLNKTTFAAVSVNTGSENKEPKAVISADGDKPVVYVSGRYYKEINGNSRACYWKDGVITDLHPAGEKESEANAIAAVAGSVYVAGSYTVSAGRFTYKIACYWKDGVRTDLHHDDLIREQISAGESQTNAITVAGNTVYIAGYYEGGRRNACYWKADAKNITRTMLYKMPTGEYHTRTDNEANGIAVLGKTVYTTGYYTGHSLIKQIACYWKDDKKTNLPSERCPSYAHKVVVSGNSVYISGYYGLYSSGSGMCSPGTYQYCYWKDGVKTLLDGNSPEIAVSGNTVYNTGHYLVGGKQRACYWEDTTRNDLDVPKNTVNSGAGPITVVENVVYIAGYYEQGKGDQVKQIPCYWIDGKRTDLSDSAFDRSELCRVGIVCSIPNPAGGGKFVTGIAVDGGQK